jgi:hypothetical protein
MAFIPIIRMAASMKVSGTAIPYAHRIFPTIPHRTADRCFVALTPNKVPSAIAIAQVRITQIGTWNSYAG